MLPKSKRLNLKKDFKRVFSGRRVETDSFKFFLKFGSNTIPLVGISLSKKHFKLATERNKARRMASKALEGVYESLPKNLNLIIMPKAKVLEKSLKEIENEFQSLKITD